MSGIVKLTLYFVVAFLLLGTVVLCQTIPSKQIEQIDAIAAAIKRHDVKEVSRLLQAGVDPNAHQWVPMGPGFTQSDGKPRLRQGRSLLILAVDAGQNEIIKILLGKGANLNGSADEETPLERAVTRENISTVWFLLTYKPRLGNALDVAANQGLTQIVELLIRKGANINGDRDGWTPLMSAAYSGHEETVRFLLKHGAKVNLHPKGDRNPKGDRTAVDVAELREFPEIVALLRRAGGKCRSQKALRAEQEEDFRRYKREAEAREQERVANARLWAQEQVVTPEDCQVIEIALVDFVTKKGIDSPFYNEKVSDVYLRDTTLQGPKDLRVSDDVTKEMTDHLKRRSWASASLASYHPVNDHIHLVEKNEHQRLRPPPGGMRISLYLPGYSRQHDRAVLCFYEIGAMFHGLETTYFLIKEGDSWRVKWRSFVRYA